MIIPERVNRQGGIVPSFQVDDHLVGEVMKHKWFLSSYGYITAKIDGIRVYLHRFVWAINKGDCPQVLDHINQDKMDNKLCNLRPASKSLNAHNSKAYSKKSGLPMGVCWDRSAAKYVAHIRIDRKRKFLGYFLTPEEAEAAYLAAKSAVLGIS
jgi:hypothetical protein